MKKIKGLELKSLKGDVGFVIKKWNHCGNYIGVNRTSVQYVIKSMTVYSCGKKEMKLFDNDENRMSREIWRPEVQIFSTFEEAEEAIKECFEIDFPKIINCTISDLQYTKERLISGKLNQQGIINVKNKIEKLISQIDGFHSGEIGLEIISKKDWIEQRENQA